MAHTRRNACAPTAELGLYTELLRDLHYIGDLGLHRPPVAISIANLAEDGARWHLPGIVSEQA